MMFLNLSLTVLVAVLLSTSTCFAQTTSSTRPSNSSSPSATNGTTTGKPTNLSSLGTTTGRPTSASVTNGTTGRPSNFSSPSVTNGTTGRPTNFSSISVNNGTTNHPSNFSSPSVTNGTQFTTPRPSNFSSPSVTNGTTGRPTNFSSISVNNGTTNHPSNFSSPSVTNGTEFTTPRPSNFSSYPSSNATYSHNTTGSPNTSWIYYNTTGHPNYNTSSSYPYHNGSTTYPYYNASTTYPYYNASTPYPYYNSSTWYPDYNNTWVPTEPTTTSNITNFNETGFFNVIEILLQLQHFFLNNGSAGSWNASQFQSNGFNMSHLLSGLNNHTLMQSVAALFIRNNMGSFITFTPQNTLTVNVTSLMTNLSELRKAINVLMKSGYIHYFIPARKPQECQREPSREDDDGENSRPEYWAPENSQGNGNVVIIINQGEASQQQKIPFFGNSGQRRPQIPFKHNRPQPPQYHPQPQYQPQPQYPQYQPQPQYQNFPNRFP